ncbi:MAG: hypothetical protein KDD50_12500 [Bdellovibrionales bacterium]|nr:hypothetical protein [Bdellovibrionales bacterium]
MKQKSKNLDRAEPIRREISKFLKTHLSDETGEVPLATRHKLAKFLDQSKSQADKVIYNGVGSFDALVSAIQFALDINPKETANVVRDLLIALKKHLQVDEADRKWYGLNITKNKRIYYASLIEQAELLANDLLIED